MSVQIAATSSTARPPEHPLAWIGSDRLLLDDVTPYGLRRKVIARKNEMMDMVMYLQLAMIQAGKATVHYWMFERDGFWFLWMVWKVRR